MTQPVNAGIAVIQGQVIVSRPDGWKTHPNARRWESPSEVLRQACRKSMENIQMNIYVWWDWELLGSA